MSTKITFTSGGIFASSRVGGAEGIVDRRHERAALQIQHGVAHSVFRAADVKAAARRALGKIRGAQQARLVRKKLHDLLAIPDVIAAGDDFDAARRTGPPRFAA